MRASSKTVADYPELLAQWHWEKNGDIKPSEIAQLSNKKVWWKCYDGTWPDGTFAHDHEWETRVADRTGPNHSGCPCCWGRKAVPSNCLATTHPNFISLWHPTKNGDLTPFDVVSGSHRTVWWKCYDGTWPDGTFAHDHEWPAIVKNVVLRKDGCPVCAGKTTVPSNCFATTHPEFAAQLHPTKNGDLTPFDVVSQSSKKVWWKCHKGKWPDGTPADDHEWEAVISSITRSPTRSGCPCCSRKKAVPSNCLNATHPELALELHKTKNVNLTAFDLLAGSSSKKVWWLCSQCKHVWPALVNDRTTNQSGCPRCKELKGEKSVSSFFLNNRILFMRQWGQSRAKLPTKFAFDFAVNRNGQFWLIEYHGEQHYYPVSFGSKKDGAKSKMFIKNVKRDGIKENWCRDRKKNLFVIPFWDFDRINEILTEFFTGTTPIISVPPGIVKKYEPMRQKILDRIANDPRYCFT